MRERRPALAIRHSTGDGIASGVGENRWCHPLGFHDLVRQDLDPHAWGCGPRRRPCAATLGSRLRAIVEIYSFPFQFGLVDRISCYAGD